MSKVRWQPLPTDEQVVAAIKDRRDKFVKHYKDAQGGREWIPEQEWAFKHICTVLDHTKRMFEISEKEFLDPGAADAFKDT